MADRDISPGAGSYTSSSSVEVTRPGYRVRPTLPAMIAEEDSLATCHTKRGACKGLITKVDTKVKAMKELELKKWSLVEIRKHLDVVDKQTRRFRELHQHIITHFAQQISAETEETAVTDFEDLMEDVRGELEAMELTISLLLELNSVDKSIRRILNAGIDPHTEVQLSKCEAAFQKIRTANGTDIDQDERLEDVSDRIAESLHQITRKVSESKGLATREVHIRHDERDHAPARSHGYDRKKDLLKVELPVFRGDILKWPSFWKDFQKHIHECDLDEDDKLGYLKRYVQSPTDVVIIHDASTGPGQYQKHIDRLCKKYDKPRKVHRLHTLELLDTSSMKNNSTDELLRLQASVTSSILKLQATGQYNIEAVLTSQVENLLTKEAREEWMKETVALKEVPKVDQLLEFMGTLADMRDETPDKGRPIKVKQEKPHSKYDGSYKKRERYGYDQPAPTTTNREAFVATSSWPMCKLCKKEPHPLYVCPVFTGYTTKKRSEHVRQANLCMNCLSSTHATDVCRNSYRCKQCKGKHHTSLHTDATPANGQAAPTQGVYLAQAEVGIEEEHDNVQDTILPTMELTVHSPTGNKIDVTALYDTGAGISVVTEELAKHLALKMMKGNVHVVGVNSPRESKPNPTVMLRMTSPHKEGAYLQTKAVVVKSIGTSNGVEGDWSILNGLQLANPHFRETKSLDVLLGNNVLADVEIPCTAHRVKVEGGSLMMRDTIYGWVINGISPKVKTRQECNKYVCAVTGQSVTQELLDEQRKTTECIEEFFKSEELPNNKTQTAEDLEALEHFQRTHIVLANGRFQVSLPKLQGHPPLGMSRPQAIQRYMANERSLLRKKGLQPFQKVVAEYLDLQHAELVPNVDLSKPAGSTYYLPMHAVYKDSTTSPLRVVFDASAATSTGTSLNDILLTGPTVYPLLTDILLRFRLHNVALTSDISKMFREIELTASDRDMHRFVWRENTQDRLKDYRMTRVTFGVSCSPFLATQTLQQIATNEAETYPEAAQALKSAFYVDDCITGTATREQAVQLQQQLQTLLGKHQFNIRKWRSNSQLVLSKIPTDLQERQTDTQPFGHTNHLKTLGVHWNASSDEFHVSTSRLTLPTTLTKRTLASDVAQTFDVLGWFAPTTIVMKMIIQELWRVKCDWDDMVDASIQRQWTTWRQELPALAAQPIPRHYFLRDKEVSYTQLHGFSDASLKGYGAAVYMRAVYYNYPPTVMLITAKTKVAHLRGATVPRLELCGADLLAKLITHVREALGMQTDQVRCWCDSEVVLWWLNGQNRQNRVYVANRVSRILGQVAATSWKHVPGIENPADCASRGISPQALLDHPLWWHGPPWLSREPIPCPPQPTLTDISHQEAVVKETVAVVCAQPDPWLVTKYSNYSKLKRILAWVMRFTTNSRIKTGQPRLSGKLTTTDLKKAEITLFKQAQQRMIPANHPERWSSDKSTRGLHPMKDDQGVYRVDGRLQNSLLKYSTRHPIILRGTDALTRLIILHHHCQTLHGGPAQVMTSLSRQHYVILGMAVVKSVCRKCVACIRFHAPREGQLMGQLPRYRVTPNFAFDVVGTDFAGPITIIRGHTRRPQHVKAYICVFVCMSTKAVHLEAVEDMTTEAFMDCLRRFVARRGKPSRICSDNGTNFIGAARKIDEIFKLMRTEEMQKHITNFCTTDGIEWSFNPAKAPHFGGIWEATVKSVKHHLRRIGYKRTFSYNQLATILAQIEAVLNSRPLMAIHGHSPEGLQVLTAGHFLVGKPLTAIPEIIQPEEGNLPRKWDYQQQATQRFWREWSHAYLQAFHKRNKWQKEAKNVEVGDIVLLRDETTFRTNEWPLARVVKVYPGQDGLVRAVDVQHKATIWRRPIAKLTVLVPVTMEKDGEKGRLKAVALSPREDVRVQGETTKETEAINHPQDQSP